MDLYLNLQNRAIMSPLIQNQQDEEEEQQQEEQAASSANANSTNQVKN